jgi:hypothetical protein
MADRAPFQRNTAVAQRLEGTSRTLITGHILRKSAKLTEVAAETGVTTPGVETVIDLVKSDAGSTARADGCQMSRQRGYGEHKPSLAWRQPFSVAGLIAQMLTLHSCMSQNT